MSVKEFTNGKYTELKVQANVIKGDFVPKLADLLDKAGIDVYGKYNFTEKFKDCYGVKFGMAVEEFQEKNNLPVTGIVNDATLDKILKVASAMSDVIYSDTGDVAEYYEDPEPNPHYDGFFNENNGKIMRRNKQDIVIDIGNGTVKKTIKNVFIRSTSLEVDTSGNPISEIYEFIAEDAKESDEPNDAVKY